MSVTCAWLACAVCAVDLLGAVPQHNVAHVAIEPPPKARVHRVGPRPKNLVRMDNYNAKQKRLAEKKKAGGGVSAR